MKRFSNTLAALLAVGPAAFPQAGSTEQILHVAGNTWPGPHTVGIVCNYKRSGENVRAMLNSFAPGTIVKVMDVRLAHHIRTACTILGRSKPQYILLLPEDPLVHDGSFEASWMISRMNHLQVPTLATTPAALAQGALAVVGPGTGNVLQVNPAIKGYYGRIELTPMKSVQSMASTRGGRPRATLSVVAAF